MDESRQESVDARQELGHRFPRTQNATLKSKARLEAYANQARSGALR